jgi:starvation-inducible DNA-binding protein
MGKSDGVKFEERAERAIELGRDGVAEISSALRELLADAFILYLKTNNFHWHMSGRHFRDYNLLLDEEGDQLFAVTDEIAERARKIGGTTLHSISDWRITTRTLPARKICSASCSATAVV